MQRLFDLDALRRALAETLSGPQMLAFLPAVCLSAYWIGGEVLLVFCALATPLAYAVFGGFGRLSNVAHRDHEHVPSLDKVAQDFLRIAQHNGQTTACFQITVPELDQIAQRLGESIAHEARDLVAARMRTALRASDHVFLSGGNRFTVLISPGFRLRLDNVLEVGKRLRQSVETPLVLANTTQALTACIGIASSLNFGRNVTVATWLASAADAMDDAVLTGTSATRLWSDRLSRRQKSRQTLQQDIMTAFDDGCIQAFFQPQVSLRTGDVTGMEAFARWHHPTRGVLAAAEFLQAAQDSQQMLRLGRTILLQSVATLVTWDKAGLDVGTISLNLSKEELQDPELATRIARDFERCELPAHRLVFDIREEVLTMASDSVIQRNLAAIAGLGCGLDLEGFGAGGCSLLAVQQFPVTRLKLDKSLVRRSVTSEDNKRALHAVLAFSERLQTPTVAAGVETMAEDSLLRELGCAFAQGFLYASPASAAETASWLEARQGTKPPLSKGQIRRIK